MYSHSQLASGAFSRSYEPMSDNGDYDDWSATRNVEGPVGGFSFFRVHQVGLPSGFPPKTTFPSMWRLRR